ncbi:MAG: DUF3079 domain-containing protein [Burkholderiales bacterium]|nr:DUF3079 domain-containing protein [Burkholderiales bacterium]
MSRKFPINPAHPERVCWGCDLFCAAKDMRCGNGSDRTMHPVELFGEGWQDWGGPAAEPGDKPVAVAARSGCTDLPPAHRHTN